MREPRQWPVSLLGLLVLAGLYVLSRQSFLLFHALAESIAIVVALAIFAIYWNARHFVADDTFLVFGTGCLFAGLLDLVYVFAYPGMAAGAGSDANVALQAKTVAQWYVSLSCVAGLASLRRRVNTSGLLVVCTAIWALAMTAIFVWPVFPDCYREGQGFTPFERLGLAVSSTAYAVAMVILVRRRREFSRRVFRLLAAALAALLVEDLLSMVAVDLNGPARTAAHLCQVVSIFFGYKAFVEVGLTKPYEILFRSQQKSAAALARKQQFLEAVLDNLQSGIVACDNKGFLSLFNRALQELHGRPVERLPPEQWAEHFGLCRSDGRTRLPMEENPLFRALHGEHVHALEMVVIHRDGTARTCLTSGAPVVGKDGVQHGAVAVVHDITERKRAEQEMRKAQELLQKAHEEQRQRHQSELAHVARLSTMGEMTASLAHELNQPLHAINNYARGSARRLLKAAQPDPEVVDALEQISAEAQRAGEIVRRVSGFVRKRAPQMSEVHLNRLVEEVVLLNKAEIDKRRTRIVLNLAPDLCPVVGDPIQIEQVLLNLVRNGLEAMEETPEERRELTVKTWAQGNKLEVEVRDCGQGIAPQDLDRVFQPFFTTKPEGMGMGLAISRSIIQSHGGRLWASNEDCGCTFHFTLPAGKKD